MKALILNSGLGSRMGAMVLEHPKCMTEISNNETILSRQLRLIYEAGIIDVVITTGAFEKILVNYCKSLDLPLNIIFVKNPLYKDTNYIYSIYCAREYLDDDIILMPLKAFQRSISPSNPIYNIKIIMVSLNEDVDYKAASEQIAVILRHMRNIYDKSKDTFEIQSTKEIQETVEKSIGSLTVFIGAVAGVSLLVGGIGIMNIMLVSVTERTREIGTRLAIGALEKEVLLQFLVESATISAVGGFIGIIFGFFMTLLLSAKLHIPFTFDVKIATVSFIFSGFIGIVFGYLPARKASRLNPIDALHHE